MRQLLLFLFVGGLTYLPAQPEFYLSGSSDALFPPGEELSRVRGSERVDLNGLHGYVLGFGGELRWTSPSSGRTIGLYSHYLTKIASDLNAQFRGKAPLPNDPAQTIDIAGQARLIAASFWRTGLRWGIVHEPQTSNLRVYLGAGLLVTTRQRAHFAVGALRQAESGIVLETEVPAGDYAFRIREGELTGRFRTPEERQLDLGNQMLRPVTAYTEIGFGWVPRKNLEMILNFQVGVTPMVDRQFYNAEEKLRGWFGVSIQAQGRVK
ncbi:MAG: hypothetical protein AAFZ52_07285 [Bacteroidota bacterium]